VKGAIEISGSPFYYYLFFYFCKPRALLKYAGIVYQVVMALLLLYLHYALKYPRIYIKQLVGLL